MGPSGAIGASILQRLDLRLLFKSPRSAAFAENGVDVGAQIFHGAESDTRD
jgi:hypothetical protein